MKTNQIVIMWLRSHHLRAVAVIAALVYGLMCALDEPMFWTYTLEDTDSQKFFLCGNIYQNPKLLEL